MCYKTSTLIYDPVNDIGCFEKQLQAQREQCRLRFIEEKTTVAWPTKRDPLCAKARSHLSVWV
jgi:hypothetical protein